MSHRPSPLRFLFGAGPSPALGTDIGLLVLRLGAGPSMLLAHGQGKLLRLFSENPSFADPFGIGAVPTLAIAVLAEWLCALLVTIGLVTRAATLPLIATMGTAFFVTHGEDAFADGEKAFLYLVAWLALLATGAGRFSADGWLASRHKAAAKPSRDPAVGA